MRILQLQDSRRIKSSPSKETCSDSPLASERLDERTLISTASFSGRLSKRTFSPPSAFVRLSLYSDE